MAKPISEDKRNMILNGNLFHAILMLAIPVMINSFIQSMYNLTDTFWLGRIGTENQSAITLVSPFQNILINFGNGITTAGAILISQYLGARDRLIQWLTTSALLHLHFQYYAHLYAGLSLRDL